MSEKHNGTKKPIDSEYNEDIRDFWTQSELTHLIRLLEDASQIVNKHETIDKNNLYFVSPESRLREAIDTAVKWAHIIDTVGNNVQRDK